MPIYLRRYYLKKIIDIQKKEFAEYEKIKNKSK